MTRTLVIGSNRGIGLEICRNLRKRGHKVEAACRTASDSLRAIDGCSVHEGIDVTQPESLEGLARELGADSIDWLMIVAGVLEDVSLRALDMDRIRRQFEVNAIGPLVATHRLRACLKNGSKVGLVTSRMGSLEDNTSGGSYGYRMSKAALNMAGRSLAHDLRDAGIAVLLLHPGYVRTDMTGHSGYIDPPESAEGLIQRMEELTLERSGGFMHANGEALPW